MSLLESGVSAVDVTFSGRELQDSSELIIKQSYLHDDIQKYFTIYEGIKAKTQIGLVTPMEKLLRADLGCGSTPLNKKIGIKQKSWDPTDMKVDLSQCYKDFNNTLFVWMQQNGLLKEQMSPTTEAFVTEIIRKAMAQDMPRLVWFGDKVADNIAGGGKLTAGVNPLDYTAINGIWKQIYAGISAGTVKNVNISENDLTTKVAQLALTADKAYNTIESLMDIADTRLLTEDEEGAPFILATRGMYNNYKKTLRAKNNDSAFEVLVNGIKVPAFDGIPIFASDTWTRTILADYDNGAFYDNPNRLIIGKKIGLGVGMNAYSDTSAIEGFLDRKSQEYIIRSMFTMDVQLLQEHLVAVAI